MLANILQRGPLGSQRALMENGVVSGFSNLADRHSPPKVTVGDDGCHSGQVLTSFYHGYCYIAVSFEI